MLNHGHTQIIPAMPMDIGTPLGGVRGATGSAAPTAPILSLVSEVAGLVSSNWDIDNTVVAGDTLTRQVQVSGGSWASLVDNTAHVISSGEDTANQIAASLNLGNGTWDIRGFVTSASTGLTSAASNTLTLIISDVVTGSNRISSAGNTRISSAGNNRKAA